MAIDPARVKALFQEAIERADPDERRAFLDREIGGDSAMRDRLDALLEVFDRPHGVLDSPLDAEATAAHGSVAGVDSSSSPSSTHADGPTLSFRGEIVPAVVDSIIAGKYKIRQEIGEGGMGSVYLAEQTKPVKRMVAMKLIKPGMDSRNVLARFESERQALALMDHPNIAKVLDAGTTDDGRPFFVMELVKGIPLTQYCDQHRLDLPARLALFRQICSAVQHAHQKGIIHRDLKPTNILVESHDDKPVPKVIDFGLAKATSGMQLSEHSLFTAFGNVTGTPLYMAPEQATFNAIDVDTRADIYALGVILYELLTGSTPIQRDTMRRAALDEMMRVIREVEPPTPSSRISSSDSLPSVAANRHIEPARLSRLVKGDLDWIVMKALAKERHRRYDSAIGMSNDVERFLNNEPVSAGPPTASYRLRKFVRRHRGRVIAASLVLLALIGGVVGTTRGMVEARAQRARAEKRLAQVARMNDILGSIFADLDPRKVEMEGKPLSAVLGERLDRATAEIEGDATGDPLAVARMQMILARSLKGLGYPVKAIVLYEKARATFAGQLGSDHPDTLASMHGIATSLGAAGQPDRALKLHEQVLALRKVKLGSDHPDTLTSMQGLAISYRETGQPDRALKLHEQVLALRKVKLGTDHPDTLASMQNLAASYRDTGQRDRSLKLFEEVVALRKVKLGPDQPETLWSMQLLAASYYDVGQQDRALKLREEVLALRKARLGPDHPATLTSMNDLANSYEGAGRRDEAIRLREEALALRKARFGIDHADTLASMQRLAASYFEVGQRNRALELAEEVLALRKGKLVPDHPDMLRIMKDLAIYYRATGRTDRAVKFFHEALIGFRRARDLAPVGSAKAREAERLIAQAESAILLLPRLPAILRGELQPKDNADRLQFAAICHERQGYAYAVRFYADAFETDPRLVEDRQAWHRYNAACNAALAVSDARQEGPALDEAARARMRHLALGWLRGELSAWSKHAAKGGPARRAKAASALRHWGGDADLASVRDVDKLPEAEREDWRRLWADVQALLAKVSTPKPES